MQLGRGCRARRDLIEAGLSEPALDGPVLWGLFGGAPAATAARWRQGDDGLSSVLPARGRQRGVGYGWFRRGRRWCAFRHELGHMEACGPRRRLQPPRRSSPRGRPRTQHHATTPKKELVHLIRHPDRPAVGDRHAQVRDCCLEVVHEAGDGAGQFGLVVLDQTVGQVAGDGAGSRFRSGTVGYFVPEAFSINDPRSARRR